MKKAGTYILSIGLALGLSYWAFKGINLSEIFSSFKDATLSWVLLSFVFTFFSHALRGVRWKLLLKPMGYEAGIISCVSAVFIGYLTNLILPRAGEFARAASLQKMDNIPAEKSFGTIVAERLIDVLALGILFMLTILVEFERIRDLLNQMFSNFYIDSYKLIGLVIFIFLIIFSLYFFRIQIDTIIKKNSFLIKLKSMATGFKDGLLSVLKIRYVWLFVLYSIGIWLMYFLTTYCLLKALPVGADVNLSVTLSVLVIGSVGMAVPSLGGLGSFHILVSAILMQYGFSKTESLGLATFQHSLNGILFLIILGAFGFGYSVFKSKSTSRL